MALDRREMSPLGTAAVLRDFLARFSDYGGTALLVLIAASLTTGAAVAVMRGRPGSVRRIARVLLVDALLVIGLFTLLPAYGRGQSVNLIPGRGLTLAPFSLLEFAANAALFVPAGALLRLAFPRRPLALATLALAVPVTIEWLQFALELGRVADVNDVLANALGSSAGFVLAAFLTPRAWQAAASPVPSTWVPPECTRGRAAVPRCPHDG